MQLNKSEIIQEFITQDEERFALAVDIYDSFPNIIKQILASICHHIIIELNDAYSLNLNATLRIGTLTNLFYFDIDVDAYNFVRVLFYNYFQSQITLRLFRHNEQVGDVIGFNTSALSEIRTYPMLFQVYQNTNGLRDRLVENCRNIFGEKLAEMVAEVNSDIHSNGHVS